MSTSNPLSGYHVTAESKPITGAPAPDATITLDISGENDVEPVTFLQLLAAVCLAESGGYPASWAVQLSALGTGWDLAVAAFGSITEAHDAHFTSQEISQIVVLAERLKAIHPAARSGRRWPNS